MSDPCQIIVCMGSVKDVGGCPNPAQTTSFLDLNDDLTARILVRLKPREIAATALTCKRLAAACADDARVWQPLCAATWSPHTNPERWLQPDLSPSGSETHKWHQAPRLARPAFLGNDDEGDAGEGPLTTFRSVFAALRRLQPLMGLWRGAGDAPRGSLFRVGFAPAGEPHVEVVALRAGTGGAAQGGGDGHDEAAAEAAVVEEVMARVGAAFPGCVLQLVDESFALLKDEPWKRGARRGPSEGPSGSAGGHPAAGAAAATGAGRPSAAALAAAAVATGGRGDAELLGASPPRSFEYEVLRFMEVNVAGSRSSSRKNRNRGGAGAGAVGSPGPYRAPHQPIILKHLVRLQLPTASRQRPLCGLWTGVYGPHGLEVVSVGYEGRGAGSRIVATKVTGDPNVPAGEVTFRVEAEPVPQPWPLAEVELITNRPLYTADRPGALAAALEAAAAEAAVPPQHQRLPQGIMVLPVWAIPGVAAAVQAAINDGGEEQDVHAPIAERLAAVAAAAAAADPVDLWDYLGPAGPPPVAQPPPPPPPPPLQEGQPQGQQQQQQERAPKRQPARVVAVYRGEGRVAGTNFTNPAWIEGRLWVYDNGSIGFVWCREVGFLVDYERMSPQMMGRGGGLPGAAGGP